MTGPFRVVAACTACPAEHEFVVDADAPPREGDLVSGRCADCDHGPAGARAEVVLVLGLSGG